MSEASSKPRHGPGMTGHPALSRKTTRKSRNHQISESSGMGGKTLISETSSVMTTSTRPHFQTNTKFENTYRMEPYEDKKFKASSKVHDAVYGLLESYLCDHTYDPDRSPTLTKDLTEMVKQRLKEMDFERYKLVVTIILGEDRGQGMEMASRFLWNTNTDNYVTVNYKNGSMFAVATIYAVFFE